MKQGIKLCVGVVAAGCMLWAVACEGASRPTKGGTFRPPNFPVNSASVDFPREPGTRYEMNRYVKEIPAERRDLVVMVIGGTEAQWQKNEMGSYKVGDRVNFEFVVGDKESPYFGSMKDRRDGGDFQATLFWMDAAGKTVVKTDKDTVRPACAACAGFLTLYFNVPTYAVTGRHRLNLSYVHQKLGIKLEKDLYFDVVNDGKDYDSAALSRMLATYPTVIVLQNGMPAKDLGIQSYDGTSDTYIMAPHKVPDRSKDASNFGASPILSLGAYGQENRTLIRFDVAKVPANAVLAEACLELYAAHRPESKGAFAPAAYEVLKDWAAGKGVAKKAGAGEVTWQSSASPKPWDKPGCGEPGSDRSTDAVGKDGVFGGVGTWFSLPLDKAVVMRWFKDPASNRGLILDAFGNRRTDFHPSEFVDSAMRPRLILGFSEGFVAPSMCAPDGACPFPKAGEKRP